MLRIFLLYGVILFSNYKTPIPDPNCTNILTSALECNDKTASGLENILDSCGIENVSTATLIASDSYYIKLLIETHKKDQYILYLTSNFTVDKITKIIHKDEVPYRVFIE